MSEEEMSDLDAARLATFGIGPQAASYAENPRHLVYELSVKLEMAREHLERLKGMMEANLAEYRADAVQQEIDLRQNIYWEIHAELVCCTPDMECHNTRGHDMCKYATMASNIALGELKPDTSKITDWRYA